MQTYPVQQWYSVSVVICLALCLLFAWQLTRGFEVGALLFFGVCVAIAAWQWRAARTRVAIHEDRLIVTAPFSSDREVEFRQLLDVVQEGRVNPSIMVLYHPRSEDGLLALDDVETLTLPAVQDQITLLDRLEGQVPR
jgi:hypothetical protein